MAHFCDSGISRAVFRELRGENFSAEAPPLRALAARGALKLREASENLPRSSEETFESLFEPKKVTKEGLRRPSPR
jgi:hypothetical protein